MIMPIQFEGSMQSSFTLKVTFRLHTLHCCSCPEAKTNRCSALLWGVLGGDVVILERYVRVGMRAKCRQGAESAVRGMLFLTVQRDTENVGRDHYHALTRYSLT